MFTYKNTSLSVKTFYGVQFKPGEIHSVPGFINDPFMIRSNDKPKEAAKPASQSLKTPGQSNKSSQPTARAQAQVVEKEESESNKTEIKGGESEDGTDNNQ